MNIKEFICARKAMVKKNKTISVVNGALEKIQADYLVKHRKMISQSEIIDYAVYRLEQELSENKEESFFDDSNQKVQFKNNSSVGYNPRADDPGPDLNEGDEYDDYDYKSEPYEPIDPKF